MLYLEPLTLPVLGADPSVPSGSLYVNATAGLKWYDSSGWNTAMDLESTQTITGSKIFANGDQTYLPISPYKQRVRVATTGANITLSGLQTIDGVALVAGDRVLVKDQISSNGNGIYVASSGAWTRATDADTPAKLGSATVGVDQGSTNYGTDWSTRFESTGTIGASSIVWNRDLDATMLAVANGVASLDANGFIPILQIPVAGGTNTSSAVARGDDPRLSDTRTPSNDSDIVHISAAETISGAKTFTASYVKANDYVIGTHYVGRGYVASNKNTSSSGGITTTAADILSVGSVGLLLNRWYLITAQINVQSTVAGDDIGLYLLVDSTTIGVGQYRAQKASSSYAATLVGLFYGQGTSSTVHVQMIRTAGSGTVSSFGSTTQPFFVVVQDLGSN